MLPRRPPPAPIATGDIVTQAQTDTSTLQADRAALSPDTTLQAVSDDKLPQISKRIAAQSADDKQLLASNPTLSSLQRSQLALAIVPR